MSTDDLSLQLSIVGSIIRRDAVQKLISHWRTAHIPIIGVEADVRHGRAVIRIEVPRVTRKLLRLFPCDIEGYAVLVEEPYQALNRVKH